MIAGAVRQVTAGPLPPKGFCTREIDEIIKKCVDEGADTHDAIRKVVAKAARERCTA